MLETRIQGAYSSLLALKPRQVLLKHQNMEQNKADFIEVPKDPPNTSKFRHDVLLNSIFTYLQRHGFSKTLESLSSESDVMNIGSADHSLDLEEVCLKYMSMCNHAGTTEKSQQQELKMDVIVKHAENGKKKKKVTEKSGNKSAKVISIDTKKVSKSKKSVDVNDPVPDFEVKSKKRSDSLDLESELVEQVSAELENASAIDMDKGFKAKASMERTGGTLKSKKKEKETVNTEQVNSELFSKTKDSKVKKKKSRKGGETLEDGNGEIDEKCVCDLQLVESTKKNEDKKKKKLDSESFGIEVEHQHLESSGKKRKGKSLESECLSNVDGNKVFDSKMDDIEIVHEKVPKKEKKSSKKRKCEESGKNHSQSIDEAIQKKSKRRKTHNHGENESEKLAELNGIPEFVVSSGNIEEIKVQNAPEKNLSTLEINSFDKNGTAEKSMSEKSIQKQSNGSFKSKTVNSFQRVKVDEVDFSDKRLQDNSYWAKGGAESGYGAKAQDVLGQVRGRDFRHEKTKKKRGSYRGGQIDLESHSIKFNNSDDD